MNKSFSDIPTVLVGATVFIIEQFASHPISAIIGAISIIMAWERYKTRRIERQKSELELKRSEYLFENEKKISLDLDEETNSPGTKSIEGN